MELLDRLKTAPYGAFAIDLEQNIIFWNPRAERILGFEPRQVLGRKCYEVLQGLALEGAIPFCTRDCPAIAAARAGHIPAATQARMQCSSGERKQVTVIPLIAHDDQDRTGPGPHVPRNSRPGTLPQQERSPACHPPGTRGARPAGTGDEAHGYCRQPLHQRPYGPKAYQQRRGETPFPRRNVRGPGRPAATPHLTAPDCPVRSPGRRYRNLGIPLRCVQ